MTKPFVEDQQVLDALAQVGVKYQTSNVPGLTQDQRNEILDKVKSYKRIKEILERSLNRDAARLRAFIKNYSDIRYHGITQSAPGQGLWFKKIALRYTTSEDEDAVNHLDDARPTVRPGDRGTSVEYFFEKLINEDQYRQELIELGGFNPVYNKNSNPDGWVGIDLATTYDEMVDALGKVHKMGDKFVDSRENPDFGKVEYLKILDRELLVGQNSGGAKTYRSVVLNFLRWVEGENKKQDSIKEDVESIIGIKGGTTSGLELKEAESEEQPITEVVERERRFQDQCFLTSNFNKIFESTGTTNYEHFISLQGEPFVATNNMTFHKGQKAFADLTSLEMSMLFPKIKLSKVFYTKKDGKFQTLASVPFKFGTFNDFKDPSMLTMSRRARGDDAGIESFSFSFEGQDYATADKIIVCNATYFFKSMSDFISDFKHGERTFSYSDLAAYPAGREEFAIKAEVGWQTPDDLSTLVGSNRADKIKKAAASAKLAIFLKVTSFNYEINEDGSLKVFAEYRGWINDMLSGLKFDIFLSPDTGGEVDDLKLATAEHLVSILKDPFERDRKLSDIIDNVATDIDLGVSVGDDPRRVFVNDIGRVAQSIGSKQDVQSTLLKYVDQGTGIDKNITFSQYAINTSPSPDRDANPARRQETLQKFLDESRRNVKKIQEEGLLINHDGLLEEVFEEGLVYRVDIPEDSLSDYQTKDLNKRLSPSIRKTSQIMEKKDVFTVETLDANIQNNIGENLISATNRSFRNRAARTNDARDFPAAGGPNGRFSGGGGYKIYFVTFGNILNTIMKRVYSPRNKDKNAYIKKFNMIVGSASTETGPFSGDEASIADIPVSLDLFTYWYLTEIMESGNVTYDIGKFVQNMLDKLILPALGADCQEDTEVSDLYTVKGQVYNSTGKIMNKAEGRALERGDRLDGTDIFAKNTRSYTLKNINSYYYIYMDSRTALKGFKKFEQQKEDGRIMTLGTGYNKGLTRSIKFKGNDIRYFQEAADAALRDKSGNNNARRMLKFHNTDIDLFGNTIFYPGMVVYIAPNFPGIRTPFGNPVRPVVTATNIANSLGIGGYYVITKVRSSIDSSGGFQTSLEANYEAGAH